MAAQRSYLSNLFFIRRRPMLQGSLQDWQKPDDDAAYQELIRSHNFLTTRDIQDYIQTKAPDLTLANFSTLVDDLELLNGETYLHHYFQYDVAAAHYQNNFYLYNWIFVFGAFMTALLAYLSVGSSNSIIWLATGIIGFITTVYTFKNNREVPQREWYVNRRRAETLRSHYYQYLAQVPPYHGSNENREVRLLQTLVQVSSLGKRRQGTQAAPPAGDTVVNQRSRSNLNQAEAQFLREVYVNNRLRVQENWYKGRMGEFRQNSGFTHMAAAMLMGLSTLIAGSNLVTSDETALFLLILLPLLAVLLPSAAAMFASFQQMYSWERQLTLYDETLEQLGSAQIPLLVGTDRPISVQRLTDAIAACEIVFATESDQWGQDVLNSNVPDRDKVLQEMFDAQLERLGLSDDDKKSVYSIIDASQPQKEPREPAAPSE